MCHHLPTALHASDEGALKPVLTVVVARIEYVAVLGSFVFIVIESVLRVLTLALRELLILASTARNLLKR